MRRQLIPRRLLFANPDRSAACISRDGRRVAFHAPFDGVLNLWVGPIDDIDKARPYAPVSGGHAPASVWLHNNRHVVFFCDRAGDENWQAHRVDVETGEVLALAPGPGVYCYVEQVSHHFPDELLIAHNQRDKQYFDIYRINAVTGRSTLVQQNDRRFAGVVTDPQFRVRFAMRCTDDGGKEFLQRGANEDWELFANVDMADAMKTHPIAFGDDGKQLYWLDSRSRDKTAVVAQDMATGAMRLLVDNAKADIDEVMLDPLSRRPIAAASIFARKRWQAIDPAYADDLAYLANIQPGDLSITGSSDDKQNWLVSYEQDVAPGRFFRYDRTTRKATFLFSSRTALEQVPLARMEPIVVRARDGLELVCYLSRPRGAAALKPTPMVLLVHGGPWSRDVWEFNPIHQWLVSRGYAVLSVNFRGSTGFGKAFVNAANLEWAGKMHDDLIDAVDWAIAQGIADPKRVGIFGGSYGGYAALVGVTFTPEKFACAVDIVGFSNLLTWVNTFPDYWKPYHDLVRTRMGDFTTEAGRRFLQDRSPLNYVDRIVRPLLIAQGANDPRVKSSESEQIVSAMQQRGIPVTYLYYSDEGHGFQRPENRLSLTAVVEAFLAKHLGGAFEPVGSDFSNSTIEFKVGRQHIAGLG